MKLNYYGLSDYLIKLFLSYLKLKSQYVMFGGELSHCFAGSGVPQGSNLGPS